MWNNIYQDNEWLLEKQLVQRYWSGPQLQMEYKQEEIVTDIPRNNWAHGQKDKHDSFLHPQTTSFLRGIIITSKAYIDLYLIIYFMIKQLKALHN